ncbi:hypothetical protein BKD30_01000 [Tersicoccus phoenicis]|uniref:DUF3618 domain-containing protein n=1 Tax=Tersicoccus phoenicis TaxID=554083 RepID=A0A1R1LP19_9MICC|nr:DUF3618 domain-containing protein [Tersicoccus phoenicis]OMH29298.1 hypothetical protein BKD30_01000 [Tersicoccus phoenicis]
MSSSNPDEIRADIERTQVELGQDVDALAEKVSPTKAVGRQTDRIRDRLTGVRHSVMGTPDARGHSQGGLGGAKDRAGDAAHQVGGRISDFTDEAGDRVREAGDAVRGAPAQVRRSAQGNPLAVGLIALGAGWLVGSLISTSRAEQQAATSLKDHAGPVLDQAKNAAGEMGENLKSDAQDAASSVKDSVTSGAEHVKSEGQDHAQDLKGESQQAAQQVKNSARS